MKSYNFIMKCFLIIFILIPSVVLAQDQATCSANTSKVWDTVLNRCVDKKSTSDARSAIDNCMLNTNRAAQKACQDGIAQAKANAAGVNGNGQGVSDLQNNGVAQAVSTAGTMVALIDLVGVGHLSSICRCRKSLAITALAAILTDKLMKQDIQKKLDDISTQYAADAGATAAKDYTAYNAQKKALEYLQTEQQAIADIADREAKRQLLLMIGYGTTIVLAFADSTVAYQAELDCLIPTPQITGPALAGTIAGSMALGALVSGKGQAVVGGIGAAGLAYLMTSIDSIRLYFDTPIGVGIIAGLGLINSTYLWGAAKDQKDTATGNAGSVDAMLKTLQDTYVDHCPNGREDLAVPACYCNNADGTKNTNRTNSQTCQNLWLSSSNKIIAAETNYNLNNPNNANGGVGCVAVNGQFDSNCKCKKLVDPSGNNACMKTTANSITGPTALSQGAFANAGGATMLNAINSLTNGGTIPPIDLNAAKGALAKQKVIGAELFKNLLADPANKGTPDPFSETAMKKIQDSIVSPKELAKLASALGPSNISIMGGNKPPPALAKAIKEAKKNSNLELSGGQGLNNKKVAKTDPSFNFGDAPGTGAGAVTQNFGEKNYDFKGNDIVKNPDASIFEIISNRYVESGLKRLFDDK